MLGIYIGPGAGKYNWVEQIVKIKARTQTIQAASASISINAYTYNSRVVPCTSFVAQLLRAPASLAVTERSILHTILRMQQNSLCHGDFFHLHKYGGPKLRSIVASSHAALMRTALKTITGWSGWIEQLQTAACEWLPAALVVAETLSPPSWDSPPIAVNLREAALGLPYLPTWTQGAQAALHAIKQNKSSEKSIQKLIYDQLVAHKFRDNFLITLSRRLTSLFLPYTLDFRDSISLEGSLASLKERSVSVVLKVLKCWNNSWATSRRCGDDKLLPCVFGCAFCRDELEHYLQCPHLLALWRFLAGSVSEDPLVRWGLISPTSMHFNQIACVFSGYHAIRRLIRTRTCQLANTENYYSNSLYREFWSVFADAFAADARELMVAHRKFSLPSFLSMLIDPSSCFIHLND